MILDRHLSPNTASGFKYANQLSFLVFMF